MLLISAEVGPYKSISEPQKVMIDRDVTVLVGMNESGKTVFLSALEKAYDVLGLAKFDPIYDYPRKDLPPYLKRHQKQPEIAVELEYELDDEEVNRLNDEMHTSLPHGWRFTESFNYANTGALGIAVDERPVIEQLLNRTQGLSSDAQSAVASSTSIREVPAKLKATNLTDKDKEFLATIEQRIAAAGKGWTSVVGWEVWQWVSPRIPRFLYFSDYDLLPSKMNLPDLAQRVEQSRLTRKP